MQKPKKDLLGLKDLSEEQITNILETAKTMKYIMSQKNKKTGHLVGKSIVTLFYENSTRTRISFEAAAKYMSAFTSSVSVGTSSVSKGENLIDTAKTIDAMGTDAIIIRHSMSGAPHLIAANVKACVINAGDGMNEHPTQALLDIFTIKEKGNNKRAEGCDSRGYCTQQGCTQQHMGAYKAWRGGFGRRARNPDTAGHIKNGGKGI